MGRAECNRRYYLKSRRPCPYCGKLITNKSRYCASCAHRGVPLLPEHSRNIGAATRGAKNCRWKGGRRKCNGYVMILVPTHPCANGMGYVYKHRLVMEAHLGRVLLPTEVVHHINGKKDDNRYENLMLFDSNANHMARHRRVADQ